MTDQIPSDFPDGVPASADAGTPSALERVVQGSGSEDLLLAAWAEPLEALEFAQVLDAVAALAAGPLGAASLRARRPSFVAAEIRLELARVSELAALARRNRGVIAESVPEIKNALGRLRIPGSVLDAQELLAIRRTLTASRLVLEELKRVEPEAPSVVPLRVELPPKPFEKKLEQSLDDDGAVRDSASPALAAARSEIRTARDRLVQRLEAIVRAVGGDGGVTLRDGRYVIPVPRDLRGRPDGIIHGESASGATLYLEPASVIPLGNAMREAEAAAQREELKVLRDLTDLLRPAQPLLKDLHAMCVAVDDLAARAKYAAQVDGYAPEVAPAPAGLVVNNGRHPLLIGGTVPVVPFDLTLEAGERTVLLSGPNTGGKSVLLKAVGLHIAMAQSGIIPPVGPESRLPIVERIFADIGDRQSIAASLSTFSAHLALLRVILDEADARSLVLLDEIGSGTDPAEGSALAGAALLALTRRQVLTLATTHLGALKRLATSAQGVVNASLQFDAATLQPTYRLQKGVPGRSYGLAIARRLGVRPDVLAEAEAQVPEAERTLDALLAQVEKREREQQLREEALREQLTYVEQRTAELEAQGARQKERDKALTERERGAERSAREQARQFLLQAREEVERAIARVKEADEAAAREARRMVEEAAGAAKAAVKRLDEKDAADGHAAVTFEPGQRVRMASGTPGDVLEVRGDGKVVVRVGSLKLVVEPGTLAPMPGGQGPARKKEPMVDVSTLEHNYELDLRGLSGDEAEHAVVAAIDAAVLAEQPYLRVIHGKGTGAVRERVQRVAKGDRRVQAHAFAPANQGGTGVTILEFGS